MIKCLQNLMTIGQEISLIASPYRIDAVKLATNKKNIYIFAIRKHLKING